MGQVLSLLEYSSFFSEDESVVFSRISLGLSLRSFGRQPGGPFSIEFTAPASIFYWSTEEIVALLKRLAPRVMWEQMVIFALTEQMSIEIVNPDTDTTCARISIRREAPSGQVAGENIVQLRGSKDG